MIKILHLGLNSPMQWCGLVPTGWEAAFQKRSWVFWQRAGCTWVSSASLCQTAYWVVLASDSSGEEAILQEKWFFSSDQHLWDQFRSTVPSPGLPRTRKTSAYRSDCNEGSPRCSRSWSTWHMRKAESWVCSAWRREGLGASYCHLQISHGSLQRRWILSSQRCTVEGWEAMHTWWNLGNSY